MAATTHRRRLFWLLPLAAALVGAATACGPSSSAQDQSQKASDRLQRHVYQSRHDVEFRNYNLRQRLADDPATILWCTFFPPGVQGASNGSTPGQAFTVPVAGKLTSSNKRPYASTYQADNGAPGTEVPGPDHMYGSSSEYRYGFDPTLGVYYEFTDLASFCTTEPTVWQAQKTTIVVSTDKALSNVTSAAEAAIRSGNPKRAYSLLRSAGTKKP